MFHVFGALASFELELVRERTLAGLAAARERGRLGGRPSALSPAKLKQARKMIGEKTPLTEVAEVLGVSRATLYRRVPELGEGRTGRRTPTHLEVTSKPRNTPIHKS